MTARTAAALLLVFPVLASADVYRWVDEEGQVHYSEQAPADRKAERVETPPPPPSDNTHVNELGGYADRAAKTRQTRGEQKAKEEAERNQAKARCTAAEGNKQVLRDFVASGISVPDGQGGYRLMTEEEHEAQLRATQAIIDRDCG